jgi:hypothetical protein
VRGFAPCEDAIDVPDQSTLENPFHLVNFLQTADKTTQQLGYQLSTLHSFFAPPLVSAYHNYHPKTQALILDSDVYRLEVTGAHNRRDTCWRVRGPLNNKVTLEFQKQRRPVSDGTGYEVSMNETEWNLAVAGYTRCNITSEEFGVSNLLLKYDIKPFGVENFTDAQLQALAFAGTSLDNVTLVNINRLLLNLTELVNIFLPPVPVVEQLVIDISNLTNASNATNATNVSAIDLGLNVSNISNISDLIDTTNLSALLNVSNLTTEFVSMPNIMNYTNCSNVTQALLAYQAFGNDDDEDFEYGYGVTQELYATASFARKPRSYRSLRTSRTFPTRRLRSSTCPTSPCSTCPTSRTLQT